MGKIIFNLVGFIICLILFKVVMAYTDEKYTLLVVYHTELNEPRKAFTLPFDNKQVCLDMKQTLVEYEKHPEKDIIAPLYDQLICISQATGKGA